MILQVKKKKETVSNKLIIVIQDMCVEAGSPIDVGLLFLLVA